MILEHAEEARVAIRCTRSLSHVRRFVYVLLRRWLWFIAVWFGIVPLSLGAALSIGGHRSSRL